MCRPPQGRNSPHHVKMSTPREKIHCPRWLLVLQVLLFMPAVYICLKFPEFQVPVCLCGSLRRPLSWDQNTIKYRSWELRSSLTDKATKLAYYYFFPYNPTAFLRQPPVFDNSYSIRYSIASSSFISLNNKDVIFWPPPRFHLGKPSHPWKMDTLRLGGGGRQRKKNFAAINIHTLAARKTRRTTSRRIAYNITVTAPFDWSAGVT